MRKHVMKFCLMLLLMMILGCMTVYASTIIQSSANKRGEESYKTIILDEGVITMTATSSLIGGVPRCNTVAQNDSGAVTYTQTYTREIQYPSGIINYSMQASGYLAPLQTQSTGTLVRHYNDGTLYYQHKATLKQSDDYIYNVYQFQH